ncbi:MAG: TIM barrel protein [Candidimonas sp.]
MRAAANLSLLYDHLPWEDRFQAAADDGFALAEMLFPYDHPPDWYARRLQRAGLRLSLVNTPTDPAAFPRGLAANPDAVARFRADFELALAVCAATGCEAIHVMAGNRNPAFDEQAHIRTLIDNLQWAASRADTITLHLEALNRIDMPGYLYHTPDRPLAVLAQAALPNAGLQYDFYHVVKQGLDVLHTLKDCRPHIRYVQVAGSPMRHEPDLARDGLKQGFDYLRQTEYAGVVGFEYRPAADVKTGLAWADTISGLLARGGDRPIP